MENIKIMSGMLLRAKAKGYAKFKYQDKYSDPVFHRDVIETLNDFEVGYKAATNERSTMEVKLMYQDGFAGRNYYILLNGVRIEVHTPRERLDEAKLRVLEIFEALNIDYDKPIEFTHDGWM